MKFVEFTGLVGSGKSTLAAEASKILRDMGWQPLSPAEATRRGMDRSLLGRLCRALLPAAAYEQIQQVLYAHVVGRFYQALFALENPGLVWHIYTSSEYRRSLPAWHQKTLLRLFFDVAGRRQFLSSRLKPGEVVIFEEGLGHRAINLFAWHVRRVDTRRVAEYFRRLPDLGIVVLVQTPGIVCAQRAEARGLPIRLRDKSPKVFERFMANSADILAVASRELSGSRQLLIQVDNQGSLEDAAQKLRVRLDEVSKLDPSETRSIVPAA
ncbi:MAG: hypothetical protein EHM70_00730 [Chloroflexota bacterium]|nr:MAG: hypothetical protein EHM70_00730 [Chloroflexota bacterium]